MRSLRRALTVGPAVAMAVVAFTPTSLAVVPVEPSSIVQHQSVRAQLDPSGTVREARVFTDVVVTGTGEVTVTTPQAATKGLRNLEGFSRPRVDDGSVVWSADVDGAAAHRSVADFDRDLPVQIAVTYTLDGRPVDADGLVGRSGELVATYTLTNMTTRPVEITYESASGDQRTKEVDVAVPYVGSLSLELDRRFRNVYAPGAVTVGNGRGDTVVNWSAVLFEPIGSTSVDLSYTAQVIDAVAPAANVQLAPVDSRSFPSLAATEDAYAGAAEQTGTLASGARELDANLIKVRDGLGSLLAGMRELSSGAEELSSGLGDASSGSGRLSTGLVDADAGGTKLASGLVELSDGATALSLGLTSARDGGRSLVDGTGQLSAGATELAAGAGDLAAGATQIDEGTGRLAEGTSSAASGAEEVLGGLQLIEGGLAQLADPEAGLPTAQAGAEALRAGVAAILAGIGSPSEPTTILGGLAALGAGLPLAQGTIDGVSGDLTNLSTAIAGEAGRLYTAYSDPTLLNCTATPSDPSCVVIAEVAAELYNPADPTNHLAYDAAYSGGVLDVVSVKLGEAIFGVAKIDGGVNAVALGLESGDAAAPGIAEGLDALVAGIGGAVAGVGELLTGTGQAAAGQSLLVDGLGELDAGAAALAAGTGQLAAGSEELATGASALDAGALQVHDGTGELTTGLDQLAAGGTKLAAGAGEASSGAGELSAGLGRLSDGGKALSAGLTRAADGSGRLAAGLVSASGGTLDLSVGSSFIQEGVAVMAGQVNEAANDAILLVEQIRAVDELGRTEALPYGAPEGATASAVYEFSIAGYAGETIRNVGRFTGAAILLLAAALVPMVMMRRRGPTAMPG